MKWGQFTRSAWWFLRLGSHEEEGQVAAGKCQTKCLTISGQGEAEAQMMDAPGGGAMERANPGAVGTAAADRRAV